jgi:hypothetical protein
MVSARAKGKTPAFERFLSELESYAYYCSESGRFCARIAGTRGGRYYNIGEPFGYMKDNGYILMTVRGTRFLAHRLVWFWFYGEWPEEELDHINQNKLDNRIENLRYGGKGINSKNTKQYNTNTSGCANVYWYTNWKKWVVRFGVNGYDKLIGAFDTFEEAVVCRNNYLVDNPYGFTIQHGQLSEQ